VERVGIIPKIELLSQLRNDTVRGLIFHSVIRDILFLFAIVVPKLEWEWDIECGTERGSPVFRNVSQFPILKIVQGRGELLSIAVTLVDRGKSAMKPESVTVVLVLCFFAAGVSSSPCFLLGFAIFGIHQRPSSVTEFVLGRGELW
jgi:hypothetical protein